MRDKIAVAIDGPSGAGKSTIAKAAALRLGFIYVDTGAMYRAIGLFVCRQGVKKEDQNSICSLLSQISIALTYQEDGQHVWLNGEDVSAAIRTPEIAGYASAVSAISQVRAFLLQLQQDIAKQNHVIMDGRDIGTVILPHAQVKIFLTASSHMRAMRRHKELLEKGIQQTLEEVEKEMIQRDNADSNRKQSPLKAAKDAVLLDTTDLSLDQSVEEVIRLIREKTAGRED